MKIKKNSCCFDYIESLSVILRIKTKKRFQVFKYLRIIGDKKKHLTGLKL